MGGGADIAVSYEACALCDDEGACGEVALDLCVCGEGELSVCDDWACDLAVDDDGLCFDGGVAVCAVGDLYFSLCGDFAFEAAEDFG